MATRTYAQLEAASDILDADLLATFRGSSGPLKRVTADQLKDFIQATPRPSTISSKSANYTVLTSDIGTVFLMSSTFTLSLPTLASATPGFFFEVRNTGSGYITIDPDSAELIDGRTTIIVYPGEAFQIVASGSSWNTIGRAREVLIYSQTTSGALSEIEVLDGFTDTEITDFRIDFRAAGSTSATLRLGCRVSGVYSTNQSQAAVVTSNGGGVSEYNQTNQTSLRLSATNTSASGILQIANGTGSPTPVSLNIMDGNLITTFGNGYVTGGRIDGVKLYYSTGNINTGSYFAIRGTR